MQLRDDWREDCPSRGPALSHAHWRDCDPKGVHPGTDERHEWGQCCHCGRVFGDAGTDVDRLLGNEAPEPAIDEDAPLELPQEGEPCAWSHEKIAVGTPLIGALGLEWPQCSNCHVYIEPKLVTGQLLGPRYGPGKGWVTERMRRRWEAIAHRYQGLFG